MTDQSMPPESRRAIEELLPWYLSGTLDAEDERRVIEALAQDPSLQAELDFLTGLRASIKAQPEVRSPGAEGLARLRVAINETEPTAAGVVIPFRRVAAQKVSGLWRPAAIAAALLLAVQIGVDLNRGAGDSWQLASGRQATSGPVLVVAFKPTASEAQIRALLRELNLQIVDGPSAIGLYRVAATEREARADVLLVRLRAASQIVETAETE